MVEIICCVVDAHSALLFKVILGNVEFVAVVICECGWVRVILLVEDAGKEVVFEFWNEVLGGC